VLTERNSLAGPSLNATDELSFFCCQMTDASFYCILENTNKKIAVEKEKAGDASKIAFKDVTMTELKGFVGCLILLGTYRAGHTQLQDIWKDSKHKMNIMQKFDHNIFGTFRRDRSKALSWNYVFDAVSFHSPNDSF
jgi:hypothetical protein